MQVDISAPLDPAFEKERHTVLLKLIRDALAWRPIEFMHPANAFVVIFGKPVSQLVLDNVNQMLLRPRKSKGFIYIFRHKQVPLNIVKIGRTNNMRRRMQEWEYALAPEKENIPFAPVDDTKYVVQLFACETLYQYACELVIHELLFDHRIRARNLKTGKPLTEFFQTFNKPMEMMLLMRVTAQYLSNYRK